MCINSKSYEQAIQRTLKCIFREYQKGNAWFCMYLHIEEYNHFSSHKEKKKKKKRIYPLLRSNILQVLKSKINGTSRIRKAQSVSQGPFKMGK